ncbi:transglycosylase domain-containing protein [Janibacter cremeus]|uniref:transglycosylase domain-containing protein n=1 Tax=Janibacter cremeus TaxID=1285192 RepID=UPI0023F77472|nr:transglycosylase domain-containing protein [Janibacter cremeus]WEV77341.1 transglycosylase domain-containing protein [Janibacter cremeus]
MADKPRTRADARRRRGASTRGRPAGGRRGKRGILRTLLLAFAALVALGVAGIVIAYLVIDIPEPNDQAVAQASVLYYSDGETEMDRIAKVNRESVELENVPEEVRHAFIAAEDRSFYDNSGISPKGILRAVSGVVFGEDRGGGSTITQQYVKNYFLTQDQTYLRKFKEILISIKIDGELSKDQILENYLNTIYFGRGADGIQTASEAYFDKDVEDLSASEGALLASVVNAPSLYDPALGEEQRKRAQGRWNYVLDGMVEQGWMTAAERQDAAFPKTTAPKRSQTRDDDIGFITEEVRAEMRRDLDITDAQLDRGGFKIVTTIDKAAQRSAAEAVSQHRPTGERASDLHIGLASIEPGDGAIRAMYGGPNFGEGKNGYFNAAVDGKMQAGSTMKPFTMIAALREGFPLDTKYSGRSPFYDDAFIYDGPGATDIQEEGGVVNYNGVSFGPVDMRTATQKSINTYYAQLNLAATPKATAEAAEAAGVTAWSGNERVPLNTDPSNVFGTDAVRVIDMANAYATISAEGMRAEPYYIKSVTGTGGRDVDYEAKPDVRRVFPEDVTRDAIQAMSRVDEPGGTGYPTVADLGRPLGGKTGTTSDNYAAWFDGFTPGQLATAVGMYKGDGRLVEKNQLTNIGGYSEITGGTVPALIWTDYMIGALKGEPVVQLPPPGNVKKKPHTDLPSGAPTPYTPPPPPPEPEPTTTQAPEPTTSSSTSSSTTSSTSSTTSSSTSSSSTSSSSSTTTTTPSPTSSSTPPPTTSTTTTEPEPSLTVPPTPGGGATTTGNGSG